MMLFLLARMEIALFPNLCLHESPVTVVGTYPSGPDSPFRYGPRICSSVPSGSDPASGEG